MLPRSRDPRGARPCPVRIVLAEDDLELRRLLAQVLRRDGHEVVEVADGAELLALLAMRAALGTAGVDLVITDVRMPRTDGLQALREIRAAGWRVPVVLITAFPEPDLLARASLLGIAHLLAKPFELADLRILAHATAQA